MESAEVLAREVELKQQWGDKSLVEIVNFIVDYYHQRLREQFKELLPLSKMVESAHKQNSLSPKGLTELLTEFSEDLEEHMNKEEQILFPLIKNGQGAHAYMPIKVMQEEHDSHDKVLSAIRAMTNNYHAPPEACGTWINLCKKLEVLDTELVEHIILENQILFVRALRP